MKKANKSGKAPQSYDFKETEKYWKKFWLEHNLYKARDNDLSKEKKYILTEFPYPSGSSLHVGHCFRYTVPDVYSRFLRMKGYNVLFPIGWDAFGLPTEERARKEGKNPKVTTKENIANFKDQVLRMGYGFDWDREINTTDPDYYKWTQWIFGEFFKAGLAEQKEVELWWCPNLGTVLANEEIIDGPKGEKLSERGEHPVYKKKMKQWVLKMPKYAEKLLEGLEQTNFPGHIKEMQRSWIGKSEGTTIQWDVVGRHSVQKTDFQEDVQELKRSLDEAKEQGKMLVACTVVKNKEGRFLVMKRADWDTGGGRWDLPGGLTGEVEDIFEAAKRELYEESGIKTNRIKYSHWYDFDLAEFNQPEKRFRCFVFYTEAENPVILSEEHQDYKWVNINEVEKYLGWENQREAVYRIVSKIYPTYTEEGLSVDYSIKPRERAVGIIKIKNTDKFVAYLKPGNRQMHFFGAGTLDEGETSEKAVIREIKEELGLSGLQCAADLGVCHKFLNYPTHGKKSLSYNVEHYFLLECTQESWNAREKAEVDESGGEVVLVREESLRRNGWDQLNWALDNLEIVEKNRLEILLATHNKSKIKRYQEKLDFQEITFVTTDDLEITISEPDENGSDEWENAKIKAKAYYQKTGKVSLAQDTGLYFDYESLKGKHSDEEFPEQPGKDSQVIAGVTLHDSQEKRYEKMLKFYTGIAKRFGGQIKAYFKDVFCLYDGQKFYKAEGIRRITFTEKVHSQKDVYFPLCSFYKVDRFNKYYHDLSEEEMEQFLEPGLKQARTLLEHFVAKEINQTLETFTTRVDTIFGATFLVIAPEHPLLFKLATKNQKLSVENYVKEVKKKSERERQIGGEKTGVFTGSYVRQPFTGKKIPIYVADYVLGGYGTGAIMAVPGHDERDAEMALKYDIPLVETVSIDGKPRNNFLEKIKQGDVFTEDGILFNSQEFSGMISAEARKEITTKLIKENKGRKEVNYKFRDWVFSRQRYWGEPFPFEYLKVDGKELTRKKQDTKYLIFDFDGVIGDTLEDFAEIVHRDLAKNMTVEEIKQEWFIGHHLSPKYKRGNVYTKEDAQDSLRKRQELGEKILSRGPRLFDEFVEQLLEFDNVKMAVVSSGSGNYIKPFTAKTGLPFTHILAAEDDLSKENKVEKVCKDWGVSPKKVYFFTDTKSDVLELWEILDARKIFGCSWGWHGYDRLREVLPDERILKEFDEIKNIFDYNKYTYINHEPYQIKLLGESDLPLTLPDVEDYQPSVDGSSPLAKSDWVEIKDDNGRQIGYREADTMPNWAGSSWYYLRYLDPHNSEELADQEKLKYWLPVDHYFGGSEHTTLHLLYSRFWHRFLFDKGIVPTPEPYNQRTNGGILLAEDGRKMSKSLDNVINPDEKLETVGADALRIYINFIGPYDATVCWQEGGLKACKRLVDNVYALNAKTVKTPVVDRKLQTGYHKMVKAVTEYLEDMKNNVAVAEIMTFTNLLKEYEEIPEQIWTGFLRAFAPMAPFITEELWYNVNGYDRNDASRSIHLQPWPEYNSELIIEENVTIAVQVNGKLRATFEVPKDSEDQEVLDKAKIKAEKWLQGKEIKFSKVIRNKVVTFAVI